MTAANIARIFEKACHEFIDVTGISDREAASKIYEDKIDILVDLKGHTRRNRLAICAMRPAPLQVTYLGFPGTSGAPFFDYAITDRTVTPKKFLPILYRKPHNS